MLPVKAIDISFRIKTAVHYELCLAEPQYIQFFQQMLHCFGIRYISCQFPIIKRQAGLFSKYKKKIQLRKFIIFFILSILDLVQGFGIAGNTGTVISPVFFFYTTFRLKAEKLLYLIITDPGK